MNALQFLCLLVSLHCILCTEYAINFKAKVNFATIQKDSISLEALPFEERGNVVYNALQSVAESSQKNVKDMLTSFGIPFKSFWISNTIIVKDIDEKILKLLHQCEDVDSIEKLEPIFLPPKEELSIETENPESQLEWNVEYISSQKAYENGYYGQGVLVGVLDSGVNHQHVDLKDKYRGKDGSHDYNWFDTTSTCRDVPCDDNGHGSHVTGTILGSNPTRQVGVAPNATFIACKGFLSDGRATDDMILGCLEWMLAPTTTSGANPDPSKRPHIINNSWGSLNKHSYYDSVIESLLAAGVTLVFSSGNEGPSCQTVGWPGAHSEVITVGALGYKELTIAYFSSCGSVPDETFVKPEVVAPGTQITSCSHISNTGYSTMQGTSMATPAVTGVIALVWGMRPDLMGSHAKTKEYLLQLTQPIESIGCSSTSNYPNNIYGYGMVNVQKIGHFCFGRQKDDPQVCSQNGKCTDTDLCDCNTNWIGSQCNIPICHGIPGNHSTVCSSRGNCLKPNTCTCTAGWTGDECQFPLCFGKSANDTQVCNGRGKCTDVDQCECFDTKNTGEQCEPTSSATKFVISFFVLSFVLILWM
jgi:hypothetical protein